MLILNPFAVSAYSNYIYAGGESIGIELKSDYILVVGSYKVDGIRPNLYAGDKIVAVNDTRVHNLKELTKSIQDKKTVTLTIIRNGEERKENIKVVTVDGVAKTGLYVKDEIMGIGTLTYVDPNSKIFGSLGHEITEKVTKSIFEINDGSIFKAKVTKIIKSEAGKAGEKVAKFDVDTTYGDINKNTKIGVYGEYKASMEAKKLYKVAAFEEVKLGEAYILTTIDDNKVEKFKINILKIAQKDNNHDILFEIVDDKLLTKSGGIIQGMSGSPIIQDDKIVGAVTHVIVDNPKKGYGIYIEKMLIEGEN